jgi:hypothetical protein
MLRRLLDQVPVGCRTTESIPSLALPNFERWLLAPDPALQQEADRLTKRLTQLELSSATPDGPCAEAQNTTDQSGLPLPSDAEDSVTL